MGTYPETILSGWAGGGGLDIGVRMALPDSRVVCLLERDAACIALLVDRMAQGWIDEAPIWTDSRTFDGRAWRGRVSGFIGGPPCQPFSVAGQRREADDERNCWPDALRITDEVRPDWCFFENVAGSLGYVGEHVKPVLEGMGYRVEAGIFSAAEVGAPHLRERLFVLADAERDAGGNAESERYGRASARPGGERGPMADATNNRRQRAIPIGDGAPAGRSGGRRPTDSGPVLADAERPELPEPQAGGRQRASAATRTGSADVADAGGGQLPQPGRRPDRRTGARPAGAALEHPPQHRCCGGDEQHGTRWAIAGTGIPLFPPYRTGDDARWASVLAERPDLAPALESGLRGLADGMAGLSRAQRLRVLGNGVVPLTAAYALVTLGRRFLT